MNQYQAVRFVFSSIFSANSSNTRNEIFKICIMSSYKNCFEQQIYKGRPLFIQVISLWNILCVIYEIIVSCIVLNFWIIVLWLKCSQISSSEAIPSSNIGLIRSWKSCQNKKKLLHQAIRKSRSMSFLVKYISKNFYRAFWYWKVISQYTLSIFSMRSLIFLTLTTWKASLNSLTKSYGAVVKT